MTNEIKLYSIIGDGFCPILGLRKINDSLYYNDTFHQAYRVKDGFIWWNSIPLGTITSIKEV